MKRIVTPCILLLLWFSLLNAQNTPPNQVYNANWAATDALDRELPTAEQTGLPRSDKYVGVFYFLWHGSHNATAVYDITKLIQQNPGNPAYGPHGFFHWWGEPEAGYYRAEDPWVIRRNIQMLVDAGVDFVYFDVTNAFTYLEQVHAFCDVSLQMRQEGLQTPYLVFCTSTNSGRTINTLYEQFYSLAQYRDLWFIWQGKPLILGKKDDPELTPEARDFFTFRYSWAWTDTKNNPHHWQWIDHTPQDWGWDTDPNIPEQLPVAVAEHPVSNRGGSFHDNVEPPLDQYKLTAFTGQGLHFREQWQRAHEVDPEVIMVTGWNEWIAQRMIKGQDGNPGEFLGEPIQNSGTYFVDAYNQEFNRDMEPMKGGHTDNRYYQFVGNVRQFKGMPPLQQAFDSTTIAIDGEFAEWESVRPVFRDPTGDTFHRHFYRYDKQQVYVNNTGRNDIVESRAAYNANSIYFYARTRDDLTPSTDANWMLLFIDADRDKNTGWEGYDFLLNLNRTSDSTTTLHAWGNGAWTEIAEIPFAYTGRQLELRAPRALVGLADSLSFYFHWADNIQKLNGISEFFINGDSAPDRRFNFYFIAAAAGAEQPPYAPSNLTASAVSSRSIDLQWTDNAVNEDYFRIERSDSVMGRWLVVDSVAANVQTWSDTTLTPATLYYYRVQAVNEYGASAYSNISYAAAFSNLPPAPPSELQVKIVSSTRLDLSWRDNADDEDGFVIFRAQNDTTSWVVVDTAAANYVAYSDDGLTPATTYFYRVRAFNAAGISAASNLARATTKSEGGMIWNFDSGAEGWTVTHDIAGYGWKSGGYIGGRITGLDPYIYSPGNLQVNATANKYIKVRMKNSSGSTAAQIYFVTATSTIWGEANHKDFPINANDPGYTDYVVDMSTIPSWNGTLTQMRIDPTTGVSSGAFSIDFIEVLATNTHVQNGAQRPSDFQLCQNFPNPFNNETRIEFSLPFDAMVKIDIYNITGQVVKTLVNEEKTAGVYVLSWNGTDENGAPLSSGVYFYRIEVGKKSEKFSEMKKMILMK